MEDQLEALWHNPRGVDEAYFCKEFLQEQELICVNGLFYTKDGLVTDESIIRKQIYDKLQQHCRTGIAKKAEALLAALRLAARSDQPLENEEEIHMANGTYNLATGFTREKKFCRHRLKVNYTGSTAPSQPWLDFLDQLLEPEDILTLQEFMGYCLIPTNRAQRMLMILGRGGEGKSRIGVVLKAILGQAMHISSLSKIENNAYARADLEHLLVMVDDDLRLEALGSTNYIKSIISADLPLDVERKYVQSYQARIYARFLAFGNGTLQALHDRSYGFFRRQIILTAKPRDPNRVDDPYLGDKLAAEAEKIFIWCLLGLYRLIGNNFHFTISQKARENWSQAVMTQNNAVEFMQSQGYFRWDKEGKISARRLYELYSLWCEDNALKPLSMRSFSGHLMANCDEYDISYSNAIPIQDGKRARGYIGIAPETSLYDLKKFSK